MLSDQPSREGAVTLPEALRAAAKFLRDCRGTEPFAYFCEHARNCEDAAAALEAAYRAGQEVTLDANDGRGLELVNFGASEMAAQIRSAIESGGRFSDENANWILDHCAPASPAVPPAGEQP